MNNLIKKYEWISFARAYLSIAKIGIQELEYQRYADSVGKNLFEYSISYRNKYLIIPVIWNLKHAIELILKSLGIYEDLKGKNGHNYFVILNEILKKENIKYTKIEITNLAKIAVKYYKCEFLNKELFKENSIITDSRNDIFRYPASHFYSLELQNLKDISDFTEINNDIQKLEFLLNEIDSRIRQNNQK